MVNLAAAFEKGGISAFRFDFAGNGYVANCLARIKLLVDIVTSKLLVIFSAMLLISSLFVLLPNPPPRA